ncbi:alginate lyase [Sphingopyxis sp. QXT-31]|uniref:alginate lyase family protein n=1 Tax=Sphingopyxis sp. QXT-31 TaxID=1357916 RepID=UPI0009790CB5|nr:alginate lyase family protein [Sphingopyxis sp. QXT-31]APZ98673.1 alginate lyase [Sphingopyxis sp. QXT-31]
MIARRSLLLATLLAWPAAAIARGDGVDIAAIERARVLPRALALLHDEPRTIAAIPATRSPAGPRDYYSEGDYWWPDPAHPDGPYIRRDGRSNPDKFDGHRDALIAFGRTVPMLAAAWKLTREDRFATAAMRHLAAWFVDPATRMSPNLNHAQAIIGVNQGRAIGVIDTLQISEVARAAQCFAEAGAPGYAAIRAGVEGWFAAYLDWLLTSPFGIEERDQKNNHGTCWLLQAASFAALLGREDVLTDARARLQTVIIPNQIEPDGRQPLELARTKPYAYALFNLDVLAATAWLLGEGKGDLIAWATPDGGSIGQAAAWMAPYIEDKARWPLPPDIEYWDGFPVRQPSLLFAGLALGRADWLALWRRLDADPATGEVVRNFPVRQPILWLAEANSGPLSAV